MRQNKPTSVVSDRLEWMKEQAVRLVLRPGALGNEECPVVVCRYLDTLPLGRAYFFLVETRDGETLIATDHVLEIHIENKTE